MLGSGVRKSQRDLDFNLNSARNTSVILGSYATFLSLSLFISEMEIINYLWSLLGGLKTKCIRDDTMHHIRHH